MKIAFRTLILFIIVFSAHKISLGQKKTLNPVFTADSLKSGNSKDVLTSFFQLAFDNLVGPQKELRFSSNPYAVMMRANPDLAVDSSYLRYTALRNLNFNFNLKLDTSFKFNGFSSGINYSILNRRDYTVFREFLTLVETKNFEYHKLNGLVVDSISALVATGNDSVTRKLGFKLNDEWTKLTTKGTGFTFNMLSTDVKAILLDLATKNNLEEAKRLISSNAKMSISSKAAEEYEKVRNAFKQRALWTIGISDTTYKDQFMFSNVVVSTQFLKGISRPESNHGLEVDIRGKLNFLNDTLISGKDLKRSLLNFEGGLNYVWRSKKTDLSFVELKMSAAYSKIFNGIYLNEREEVFTLNGTLRVRIISDIWVPIEFKYDPDLGNVFGFLSVRANFSALNKALAQMK